MSSQFVTELTPVIGAINANKIGISKLGVEGGVATLGSDGKIPISQIPPAIMGALEYQGVWDANLNSPTMPPASSSNKGFYYKVSSAGLTPINGISVWRAGDWIVSNGSTWDKVDNSELVTSVAGRLGDVTLSIEDITGLGTSASHAATDFQAPLTFVGAGVSVAGNTVTITGGGSSTQPIIYLPLTGSSGSNVITDIVGHTSVTCVGSATQISTTQSCLGTGSSLRINEDGGCLVLPGNARFNLSINDASISFWVYLISPSSQQWARLFQTRNGDVYAAIALFFNSYSLELCLGMSSNGTSNDIFSDIIATLSAVAWNHIELDFSGRNRYIFINGMLAGKITVPAPLFFDFSDLVIGGQSVGPQRSINGYVQEFMILPYCRNTANFTPPSTPMASA